MEGPTVLQVFGGYTVDYRLGEFRRIEWEEEPEWIPFDSPRGQELIAQMHGEGVFRVFNDLFHQNELEPGVAQLERKVRELGGGEIMGNAAAFLPRCGGSTHRAYGTTGRGVPVRRGDIRGSEIS